MSANQNGKTNTKIWWQPANLQESEKAFAKIDGLSELDVGNDFGSYKYMVSASLIPQLMRLDCRLRMPAASNSTVAIRRAC